ncbi:hypothetical protein D3C71_1970880 [compost metagenome]
MQRALHELRHELTEIPVICVKAVEDFVTTFVIFLLAVHECMRLDVVHASEEWLGILPRLQILKH